MSTWVLIDGGSVIDGTGTALRPASVLIENDIIKEVGEGVSAEQVPRGGELRVIDARGKTVMPGLIDSHCHLAFGQARTQEEQDLYTSVELRTLRCRVERQADAQGRRHEYLPTGRKLLHRCRDTGRNQRGDRRGSPDGHRWPFHHHEQRNFRLVPERRGGPFIEYRRSGQYT